ncbi:redoxin domain-containing protein [candidate division KSB1 bacterium]|nr:redoxin domain-containing protein [candidate division KSB1 bacterium]
MKKAVYSNLKKQRGALFVLSNCSDLKWRLAKLQVCGAAFIVLSPGPADELRKVRKRTEFPYPFVEDKGLALAKKLKLQIAADQIQPAIFAVNKKREINLVQLGRNGSYYGDKELQKYLDCEFELALQF